MKGYGVAKCASRSSRYDFTIAQTRRRGNLAPKSPGIGRILKMLIFGMPRADL